MVIALQTWVFVVVGVMVIYAVRHWLFTMNRMLGRQRPYYQDLIDERLPTLSVLIPMHNESAVAAKILEAIAQSDYPKSRLEVIPIDDHSEDATARILTEFASRYDFIKPLFRRSGARGKSRGLNDGLRAAANDVVLVFDADYYPSRGLMRELAMAFIDPEVGAVMGRVVPHNTSRNFLTRLLSLERSGGYQVDQQARFNLDLLPQYGGTVGGFRRDIALFVGGFDPNMLAEDTDLTFRLYIRGWKVAYANRAECYEEVPETWEARFRQLRRWSRGHCLALGRHCGELFRSPYLSLGQKVDGLLLLAVYSVPPLLLSGIAANALLFLLGATPALEGVLISLFVVGYSAFGNFAPVYEIGAAELLDGMCERLYLLPYMFLLFVYNSWTVTCGAMDALGDWLKPRALVWEKTERFGW